jgi:CHAD domain-containing protein
VSGPGQASLEIEFKLRLEEPVEPSRLSALAAEAGLAVSALQEHRHEDTYLDDDRESLRRAGVAVRLRQTDGHATVCCKNHGQRRAGRFEREEREETWPCDGLPVAASDLPPALRDAVEPYVFDRPLLPLLRLSVDRAECMLDKDQRHAGRLSLDHVVLEGSPGDAEFREVELEVTGDHHACESLFRQMREHLPGTVPEDDKLGHALQLRGRAPLSQNGAPRAATLAGRFHHAVDHHLGLCQAAEVGVRADRDPECLHQMRVALRRLRTLVAAAPECWSETDAAWLADLLAVAARMLGPVRDFDVMLAELPQRVGRLAGPLRHALPRAAAHLAARRAEALGTMQAWLRASDRVLAMRRAEQLLRMPLQSCNVEALTRQLRKAVRRVHRLVRAYAPDSPVADAHRTRVACKRLRYLVEDLAGDPAALDRTLRRLGRVQDRIGEVCDAAVAVEHVCVWAAEADPVAAACLGGLAQQAAVELEAARAGAAAAVANLDRRGTWRALRDAWQDPVRSPSGTFAK